MDQELNVICVAGNSAACGVRRESQTLQMRFSFQMRSKLLTFGTLNFYFKSRKQFSSIHPSRHGRPILWAEFLSSSLDRFACLGPQLLASLLSQSNCLPLSAASEAAFVARCNPYPQIPNSQNQVVVDEATNPQHQTRHSVFLFSSTAARPRSVHLSLFLSCLICCLLVAQHCLLDKQRRTSRLEL